MYPRIKCKQSVCLDKSSTLKTRMIVIITHISLSDML